LRLANLLHDLSFILDTGPLALKLQKDYNLPKKGRNDRLLRKPLKLLKRKLLGKDRLLSKLGKQMNNERLRSRPLMMRRLESWMRRRRR
jgi:hypothetical protein